ncbi:MAG: 50S ribosomal protein L32 [Patescibacteria group bacterium]|jgi:ribosomal protein L32|nr:50S ribosomal protein L32 [Patescibacteria group bacterium]
MAVPKKRRTSSTRGQRRNHDSLVAVNLVVEKTSGQAVPRRLHKAASLGLARSRKV